MKALLLVAMLTALVITGKWGHDLRNENMSLRIQVAVADYSLRREISRHHEAVTEDQGSVDYCRLMCLKDHCVCRGRKADGPCVCQHK